MQEHDSVGIGQCSANAGMQAKFDQRTVFSWHRIMLHKSWHAGQIWQADSFHLALQILFRKWWSKHASSLSWTHYDVPSGIGKPNLPPSHCITQQQFLCAKVGCDPQETTRVVIEIGNLIGARALNHRQIQNRLSQILCRRVHWVICGAVLDVYSTASSHYQLPWRYRSFCH